MLNINAIERAMRKLGMTGTALAESCGVSKEATSNWLKGESIPRPSKLATLSEVLGVPMDDLLRISQPPAPIFAYRTKLNKPVTGQLRLAAEEQARHLEQLLPFVEERPDFDPPVLSNPSLDEDQIRNAATRSRNILGLSNFDVLSNEALLRLFKIFGALLVPVIWGLNKQRHENALTVYLPSSKISWVVFSLACKRDDYKYWLAHEYGHCLTMHAMSEEDGENFAEKFAQYIVFPDAVASECLEKVRTAANGLGVIYEYAERYGISVITVLRAVDRLSERLYGKKSGLDTPQFYSGWQQQRSRMPTMSSIIFGSDTPAPSEYIDKAEALYETPVFKALRKFQHDEGGRNAAFVAGALNIGMGDALNLSRELCK